MKRLLAALAVLSGALIATTSTALAGGPVLVSKGDPYAKCSIGQSPGATVYPNAEVEPFLTQDPSRHSHLLGAWQQDRWSDGGARGLVAGYSFDGGRSWNNSVLPFSRCARGGADYDRASDPGTAIGRDGNSYSIAISFNADSIKNAVVAATSPNGGKTWTNVVPLIQDVANATTGNPFNDKELIFADPTRGRTAYAVWDRLEDVPGVGQRVRDPERDMPALQGRSSAARPRTAAPAVAALPAFTGPALFSRTTDGGKTWEKPRTIVPTGVNEQTIANYIVIDPRTDRLYDFFTYITSDGNYHIGFVTSTDRGEHWTKPTLFQDLRSVGVPNIRTGDIIPIPAIDPETGALYVVWQDSRFNGGKYDEIAISRSTDGGRHWSAPERVNQPTGQSAFTATVAINSEGKVGVTYYQLQSYPRTYLTDYILKVSSGRNLKFSDEERVDAPFDMADAPRAGGYFVGDYEGMVAPGESFHPFYVTTNSGNTANPTDVWTRSTQDDRD